MKKTTLGVKLFTVALFILSFALIFVLISEVSAFAADSVLPVTLIKGYSCSRTVGQSATIAEEPDYFISEPIPVTYGHDYSFSFYAQRSDFGMYIVGIDSSNIVTEVLAIQPKAVGSIDYSWSPTVESTVSFRFRGYTSTFDTLDLTSVIESFPTYTHTISIDGSSYTFTDENGAPPVTIEVTSTGFTMSSGDTTKTWTYSGDTFTDSGTFLGIIDSRGEVFYDGAYFSLLGSSGSDKTTVFTSLTDDHSIFSTRVEVYDSTGSTHLKSFSVSSYVSSPRATLRIYENQLVFNSLSLDSEIVWNYPGDGSIVGISFSANATSPTYVVGDMMPMGGVSGRNSVFYIYLITDSTSTPDTDLVVLPSGQYEVSKLTLTGEYMDLTDWPSDLRSVSLNFASAGSSYSEMLYKYDIYEGYCIYYDNTIAYSYGLTTEDPDWSTQAFAQIYLTSDQGVPKAFYDWFTSNFSRVGDSQVDPVFISTINVYNNDGTHLLHTVSYTGTVAPSVSLHVSENGCTISYGGKSSSWTASGDFLGFNLFPSQTLAYYRPGQTYLLSAGSTSDVSLDLYVVDSEPSSDAQDIFAGIADFFINPLLAFFNIEFIPGLSFGKISLFSFVIGLVFWFLKAAK